MNSPLVCIALAVLSATRAGDGSRVFLRDVHVVDVRAGRILRDQSLVIEGERITALGPLASLARPADATLVEGNGRYLVPGLCDTHIHLDESHAQDSLFLMVANGVTTAQCMSGTPWTLALRERLARGELVGPRLFTCGPTTAQLRVHTVAEAERAVREQKAAGYDALKMYGDGSDTMPLETYRRLIANAHELDLRVVGHAPRQLPFDAVLEAHQDSIDHMEEIVYTERSFAKVVGPWVAIQFGRERLEDHPELAGDVPDFRPPLKDAVAALAQRVRAAKLRITATLTTFAAIQASTDDGIHAMLEKDELRYVSPTVRENWTPERARFRNSGWTPHLATMAAYLKRHLELQSEMLRVFQAAGVPVMTGTDAPFDYVVPGFAVHDELAHFVAAGLTPLEALRASTLTPAETLGLKGYAGEVAVGMPADLVLLDADPLADIGATRHIAGVFLHGRWLAPEVLKQGLDELAQRNATLEQRMQPLARLLDAASFDEAFELRAHAEADARLDAWLENRVNEAGLSRLRAKKLDEAVSILRLNTTAFPKSSNAWDSLGEACFEKGAFDEALTAYEHLLELEPDDANGQHMIERVLVRLDTKQ